LEGQDVSARFVLEPQARNTAASVAAVVAEIAPRAPERVLVILAADQHVADRDSFLRCLAHAADAAREGAIVALGMSPERPLPSYGYIRRGQPLPATPRAYRIAEFVEKPTCERAAELIAEGCLWNSGNFVFQAGVMAAELERFAPDVARGAARAVADGRRSGNSLHLAADAFGRCPKISIDHAVMEHTDHAAVVPADFGWTDLGSWRAIHQAAARNVEGNLVEGDAVVLAGSNVLVRSEGPLTAVVGLNDVAVISTGAGVLVLNMQMADRVSELTEILAARSSFRVSS
jgi:mannose-1-phosphate guanylyltransferase / mannose-6-phosphate isomerase